MPTQKCRPTDVVAFDVLSESPSVPLPFTFFPCPVPHVTVFYHFLPGVTASYRNIPYAVASYRILPISTSLPLLSQLISGKQLGV